MAEKKNPYAGTQTEKNLLAAFAGESEATNKYTYFASRAKKDGYEQIIQGHMVTVAEGYHQNTTNIVGHSKSGKENLQAEGYPTTQQAQHT